MQAIKITKIKTAAAIITPTTEDYSPTGSGSYRTGATTGTVTGSETGSGSGSAL
jgi:hypothetical protein